MSRHNLNDPAGREALLRSIKPEDARTHQSLLRRLLRIEIETRELGKANDYSENLFWCAFLLHMVGDPMDVPLLWRVRCIDFDAGCYFDWQNLFAGDYRTTMAYLENHAHTDIVKFMRDCYENEGLEGLDAWRSGRIEFYY